MEFLIRFVQIHESFRMPEIEALAVLTNVNIEFLFYSEDVRLISFSDFYVQCRTNCLFKRK